jgi:hypothetical protein
LDEISSGAISNTEVSERLNVLKPRNSLPNTGKGKVDKVKLKSLLARSSVEMEKCVDTGYMPVFGYPPLCFSPVGSKKEIKDKFWKRLYDNTMKAK